MHSKHLTTSSTDAEHKIPNQKLW